MRLLAEISPVILAASGWAMAQVSGLDPSVANLIGNGITVAVLAWYVLYDVRVRTPNMLSGFAKEQEEIRRAFKEEQAGSRETFTKTLDMIRTVFQNEQTAVRMDNKDDRISIRASHAEEISHWRKMVNDMLAGVRTAVHDVKDTAQLAISRSELAATIPKTTADQEGTTRPGRPG